MQQLPSFIGGFRSGTTLLINLLGMHSMVVPWFETKELCELLRWLRVEARPEEIAFETGYVAPQTIPGFELQAVYARMLWQMRATASRLSGALASGKASHERYPLGNDHIRYTLAAAEGLLEQWRKHCLADSTPAGIQEASAVLLGELSQAQRASAAKACLINKTPEISRFAPELRALLGRCRVMYMVRNGLEVVASASRLGWGRTEELAYNWKGLLERTRSGMRGFEADYLELRYELLLDHPARELDRVCAFLDLPAEGDRIAREFRDRYGAGAFERPPEAGEVVLPAEERARFMAIAGDLQNALGYAA